MLVAEVYGKAFKEAHGHEDYHTSAVFGHLRYLPPSVFWPGLFARARTLRPEISLADRVAADGCSISQYSTLKIYFWPEHREFGEPDMLVAFSGDTLRPLVVLIEVKLWSEKSGTGEKDQLVRYLRLLEDLPHLDRAEDLPKEPITYLVYLTPRESAAEIEESLAASGSRTGDRERVFRLQWQDVLEAAGDALRRCGERMWQGILSDVRAFLRRRGLEYFKGFGFVRELPELEGRDGSFFRAFLGFTKEPDLQDVEPLTGRWVQ